MTQHLVPRVSGDGVRLDVFTLDDVEVVTRACQDQEVHRWTATLPWPYSESNAHDWIVTHDEQRRRGVAYHCAVRDIVTGVFSGSISLERAGENDTTGAIGYWTAPWARRRGVASEALRLLSSWAEDALGLSDLALVTMIGNVGSERVAANADFTVAGTSDEHRPAGTSIPYRVTVWQRTAQRQ